jgi:hypothetical protein
MRILPRGAGVSTAALADPRVPGFSLRTRHRNGEKRPSRWLKPRAVEPHVRSHQTGIPIQVDQDERQGVRHAVGDDWHGEVPATREKEHA